MGLEMRNLATGAQGGPFLGAVVEGGYVKKEDETSRIP